MPRVARRPFLLAAASVVVVPHALAAAELEIWKMRGCACCDVWADRFVAAGFRAEVHAMDDLDPIRTAAGVPAELGGCHTAKVQGYVIEGHVPVRAVHRLLAERPAVVGIAVPGMPIGSPGMEIAGRPADPYDVIAFAAGGDRYLFMAVRP